MNACHNPRQCKNDPLHRMMALQCFPGMLRLHFLANSSENPIRLIFGFSIYLTVEVSVVWPASLRDVAG